MYNKRIVVQIAYEFHRLCIRDESKKYIFYFLQKINYVRLIRTKTTKFLN